MNTYLASFNYKYKGHYYYLPYSAATIWMEAIQDSEVREKHQLKSIFCLRTPLDQILQQLEDPSVFAFSHYIWNKSYNLELAKQVKSIYPKCEIIFGGPEVPDDEKIYAFMESHPFIDFAISGPGEISFKKLLQRIESPSDFSDIGHLAWRKEGLVIFNKHSEKRVELTEINSPYLNGLFDHIDRPKDFSPIPIIESNRGCPYSCTFCDWGSLTNSKLTTATEGRVFKELEWCSENRVPFIAWADANFGIIEQDLKILEKVIELKKNSGFPSRFYCAFAKKSSQRRVFEIGKKLQETDLLPYFTISLQSFSEKSIQAINRKNLLHPDLHFWLEQSKIYNLKVNIELILGLPEDTMADFLSGFFEILKSKAKIDFIVHPNMIIENAEMTGQGLDCVQAPLFMPSSIVEDEILEYGTYSVGSPSMTSQQWVDCLYFSFCLKALMQHHDFSECLFNYIDTSESSTQPLIPIIEILKKYQASSKDRTNPFQMVYGHITRFSRGSDTLTIPAKWHHFLAQNHPTDFLIDEIKDEDVRFICSQINLLTDNLKQCPINT